MKNSALVLFRIVSVITLMACVQSTCFSQTSLAIDKGGKVKRIHFYTGYRIEVKVKEEKKSIVGFIENVEDSAIILEGRRIKISEIDYVINPNGAYIWRFLSAVGIKGGLVYFTLDAGNRLINGDRPVIDDKVLKVSVPILFVGVVATLLKNKKYRNDGSNIKIVKL
jgi:hypothetical protein